MSLILGCLFLMIPLLAQGFDCNKPDFGARIEDLNKDGYFIKYMEKQGISYYNFTGPCRMDLHNHASPSISYAFIDNQLYARIIKFTGENTIPLDLKNKMQEYVSKQIGSSPVEIKQDGDWSIYQWVNEKEKLRIKVKINNKTNEGKGAFYYEPLRAKLKLINEADDPTYLLH
jgi:hypothetical protein